MTGLVDPRGNPISSSDYKKAKPPAKGNAYAPWAGREPALAGLPGGGIVQFDLNKLTLADFRNMRDHYQVNASLSVLTFMLHQSDWHIECEDKKIAEHCEKNLREIWTPLCRSLGTAHWAGFSPNVLDWDNDLLNNTLQLTKVKDLYPEEVRVNWKLVEGWAPPGHQPPKFKEYDGIKFPAFNDRYSGGGGWPIPVDNTLWFPLLMENGDYTGKKLLKPAFQSWFFSILVHLFANRYYERYGEPTPIGRAPFDDELDVSGTQVKGNEFMLKILQQLRSRSVVVLPNDMTDKGGGKMEYDYALEYLESQMRGADFERYLTRLDEEVSIGIFTPILLMRTADVGSYNLGVGHMQTYLWMLNALNGDRKVYIDKYLLNRMKKFNFSERAPDPKIVFRKMGNSDMDMIRAVMTELIRGGKAEPDLNELGTMAGLSLKKIKELAPTDPVQQDPRTDRQNPAADKGTGPKGVGEPRATAKAVAARIAPQVVNAFQQNRFGPGLKLNMGYKKRMFESLLVEGFKDAEKITNELYGQMDHWIGFILDTCPSDFTTPESFVDLFSRKFDSLLEALVGV